MTISTERNLDNYGSNNSSIQPFAVGSGLGLKIFEKPRRTSVDNLRLERYTASGRASILEKYSISGLKSSGTYMSEKYEAASYPENSSRPENTPRYGSKISEHSSALVSSTRSSPRERFTISPKSSSERIRSTIGYSRFRTFRTTNNKCLSSSYKDIVKGQNNIHVNKESHQEFSYKHARDTNSNRLKENIWNRISENNKNKYSKLVTRSTSPTQPSSLSCVRSRRLDAFEVIKNDVPLFRKTIKTKDQEVQVDQNEDLRFSGLSGSSKISGTPWVSCLEKFNSSCSSSGISYSSRNDTPPGALIASRLNNYGFSRSNETPSCSTSENFQKAISDLSCDNTISSSINSHNVKPQLQNANETPNFNNSPIKKKIEAVEEESKKCIVTSEESYQRALSISTVSKDEMRGIRQKSFLNARGRTPVSINEVGMKEKSAGRSFTYKDFQQSVLNMENCHSTHSQMERTYKKKNWKSMSASPQASQSETNMKNFKQANSFSSWTYLKLNRSYSKVDALSNTRRYKIKKHSLEALFTQLDSQSVEQTPALKRFSNSEESSKLSLSYSSSSEEGCHIYSQGSNLGSSVVASSAEELCPEIQGSFILSSGSWPRQDRTGNTEKEKKFIVKTLVPATTIFITEQHDLGEIRSGAQVNSKEKYSDYTKKPNENVLPKTVQRSLSTSSSFGNYEHNVEVRCRKSRTKQYSSSEKPWWMDPNSDNVPEGVERNSFINGDISQETTVSTILPDDGKFQSKVWRQNSEEKTWWLNASDNSLEDEVKKETVSESMYSRNGSSNESARSSFKRNTFRQQHSGEQAWWMSSNPQDVPEGVVVIRALPCNSKNIAISETCNNEECFPRTVRTSKLAASGKKASSMDLDVNDTNGIRKLSKGTSKSSTASFDSNEKIVISVPLKSNRHQKLRRSQDPIEFLHISPDDEPFGDQINPKKIENRSDPLDNYDIRASHYAEDKSRIEPRKLCAFGKSSCDHSLFIGNHSNIHDLLGPEASPSLSDVKVCVRQEQNIDESSSVSSKFEETDSSQMNIDDNIPKKNIDRPQPDGYIPLTRRGKETSRNLQMYKPLMK
ncbi:uncharacterized protein LOC117177865 isoform X2 [Belonocnema kinseyi]|nr:uncharacterized protein LOC117177865 isoform X2 [Belonocnema kinseyi]